MDEYNDYMFSDPLDRPIPVSDASIYEPYMLDLLGNIQTKPKQKREKMDITKKAFDMGASRATKEFMKSAGIIDAILGAQAKDPRKFMLGSGVVGALAAAQGAPLMMGKGSAAHALADLIGENSTKAVGLGLGGLSLGAAALLGSSAPGIFTPTTIEQRLASEVAAKLQNPETMGNTLKHLGVGGLAALAVPAAIFQLGRTVGENDSSIL
jgi:hypothetical protein